MILSIELVFGTSLLYILILFMVANYADKRKEHGRSIISNPLIYSLSIGVYATTWTYYGSVGRAATTGIDFLLIYLGPTLTTFSWWFVLRKIIRISKENNITSIADFISSRYGKSQLLGALVTVIAIIGIMPYIALQLKAVSSTFDIICGYPFMQLPFMPGALPISIHTSFLAALFFSIFGVIFGARNLMSSEQHEGLVAAIAVESIVKLIAFMVIGLFVTYGLFDGFIDILARMKAKEATFEQLVTINESSASYMNWFSTLWLSMGAIVLLPRQFHVAVIENSDEAHIKTAMWLFPAYMFLLNLFVIPVAFGGILYSGAIFGADYFVLNLPLQSGHTWLALLAFLGGFSAAAGMVIVESVVTSTMFLNHLIMPIIVRLKPRDWFPRLLLNLKRVGIFLIVFLGYIYQSIVGETYMLVNIGLISFAAAIQFGPALFGGLYWRRGNKAGAITGIFLGFALWSYTLVVPSLIKSGWWHSDILTKGPFGIGLLKPTELFGLTGLDIWSHAFFWCLLLNITGYVVCSILFTQGSREKDQADKFVDILMPRSKNTQWETKRLTKPVAIMQFVNLLSKFIGEAQAVATIRKYQGNRAMDENEAVSEFELPKLKRFAERTLAGSVGAAAASAIMESFLSELGSRMESIYDVFSTVRTSLAESKENLSVRLRASQIMNRTFDLQIIMDDLLDLIRREFKLDLVIIRLQEEQDILTVRSHQGSDEYSSLTQNDLAQALSAYVRESLLSHQVQVVNDTRNIARTGSREFMESENIRCFAHIPIARVGEPPMGILSLFCKSLVGIFTEEFLNLLLSLAGQLAQTVTIVSEMEARERERQGKEQALLENVRVARDMEIARKIQFSLLPSALPELPGAVFAGICIPAAHVGGDYYDFFLRGEQVIDIVIADVSGHSVGAALIMAETRSLLRAWVYPAATAPEVLSFLNELLYEDLTNAELFITMFYVKYSVSNRMLSFANAGHNRPLLFREGEMACIELDAEGLILGVMRGVNFEDKSILVLAGDILLLYTDGITEAQNTCGEFFGIGRLGKIIVDNHTEQPNKIIDSVLESVNAFCQSQPLQDDISMVVLKVI